jgi:hypothetical protein
VPYAPTAGLTIDEVKDVDRDGRLDILTPGPYSDVSTDMGGGFGAGELAENLLVAHSLSDGTFSLDDPVAVAAARRWCPRSPRITFARNGESAEDEERERFRHNASIICARLWGQTTESLTRAIRTACPCARDKALLREYRERACESSRVGPLCNDALVQLKWVKLEPPFRLN